MFFTFASKLSGIDLSEWMMTLFSSVIRAAESFSKHWWSTLRNRLTWRISLRDSEPERIWGWLLERLG